MTQKKSQAIRASAISLAVAGMLMTANVYAGKIDNSNPDIASGAFLGDCGVVGSPTACVGAWDLGNVNVSLINAAGSTFGTFNETDGTYTPMSTGDSFASYITDAVNGIMARVTGKVWPVGEPTGIKAVYGDTATKNGKPNNCLINTSFLSPADSLDPTTAYLDSAHPKPVICSSPFQTHKRFKIAMQPATVAGVANGAEGKPIDMVFNVTDGGGLQPYQVFSKINNYTGKRLKGYKVMVGTGVGASFVSASTQGIADKLHISLGRGEGANSTGTLDGSNIFDDEGLATFSHGLFGPIELPHFATTGFFDERTAGFEVEQMCSAGPCNTVANPFATGADLIQSDTIYSTVTLPSNYNGPATLPLTTPLFGDWLPSIWQPKGIFFDDDNDPTTDAVLVAWWNGTGWFKRYDTVSSQSFLPVSATEYSTWMANPLYAIDTIEDVLNLGINYIVKVGDDLDNDVSTTTSKITIRIIPVVADTQVVPAWVPVPTVTPVTSSGGGGGGGCTLANGNAPIDPTLPALAALGLIGLGVRRLRRS